jgi:transposase
VIDARDRFRRRMRRWSLERLVFIDESGVNLSETRSHGWAPRGERVADDIPAHRETYSIIAALRGTGVFAPMLIAGAMNTDAMLAWVEGVLAPKLRQGDIVIWDNVRFHFAPEVLDAIKKVGARVEFLPPYSPDLNPIEEAWSKTKAFLRVAKARAFDVLIDALGAALRDISRSDCIGWFKHAGYAAI